MVHLITELSKYLMIILFALYTYQCFAVLKRKIEPEKSADGLYVSYPSECLCSIIFFYQKSRFDFVLSDAGSIFYCGTDLLSDHLPQGIPTGSE